MNSIARKNDVKKIDVLYNVLCCGSINPVYGVIELNKWDVLPRKLLRFQKGYFMSKAERDRFDKSEQWQRVWRRDRGECQHCGALAATNGTAQLAHVIANTRTMRRMYGPLVIDDDRNLLLTCSLACNAAVQITNRPVEREALAELIRRGE